MASIIRATTTSGLQIAPDNSGSLQLQTNGTTAAVTIDTSQNVGIGTASPATTLDVSVPSASTQVSSTTGTNRVFSRVVNSGGNFYFGIDSSTGGLFGNGNYARNIYSDGAYPMVFATNATERMRIDSGGSVFAGVTTLTGTLGVITAQGVIGSKYAFRSHVNATDSNGQMSFTNPNGIVGSISTNGSTTTYATSSDYRLKDNIAPMTGALDTISQLKPVTYTWKTDGSNGQGFIAHELQAVVPDAVSGEKDAVNEDGSIKAQGVDTSFLVATLTAAIKEQQTIINDLKARVETLEAK